MAENNVVDFPKMERELRDLALSVRSQSTYGKGGGGDDGMMERIVKVEVKLEALDGRMGRLEGRMEGIDTRLRGVEGGLATLAERVAHLPSKGFIVTVTMLTMGVVAGFSVFGENVRTALGL